MACGCGEKGRCGQASNEASSPSVRATDSTFDAGPWCYFPAHCDRTLWSPCGLRCSLWWRKRKKAKLQTGAGMSAACIWSLPDAP